MTLLARLTDSVSRNYAQRVEPLLFRFKRSRRLQAFDIADEQALSSVPLELDPACTAGPGCGGLVQRYRNYYSRYARRTPDGSWFPGGGVPAVLHLDEFDSYAAYEGALRKKSKSFAYGARKAAKSGYAAERFHFANHTPDICEIRRSMKFRAFGPVLDALFLKVEHLGGAPSTLQATPEPACATHWECFFGVFRDRPGHRQGALSLHRELVAYARLHRIGNVVRFADFMGHRDHMPNGVMMLLQTEIVRWLLDAGGANTRGVRYLTYGAIEQGSEGLLFWKRRALFKPTLLD